MIYSLENSDWNDFFNQQTKMPYFQNLITFLHAEEKTGKIIYPPKKDWFNALALTPVAKIRVVVLGQDPYHGPNQAHGLSFSIPKSQKKIPPSLQNIFKEIGISTPVHGNLEDWVSQGVFLLNSTLTVEKDRAGSHQNKGWEVFTDAIIQKISTEKTGIIFVLWGNFAISKKKYIDLTKHIVLRAPHPSPLSAHRGFLGCGHFSEINKIFKKRGESEINWNIF